MSEQRARPDSAAQPPVSPAAGTPVPVLVAEPGDDPWRGWEGVEALLLTGQGVLILRREATYRYAYPAQPSDFHRLFGATGRELVQPGKHWRAVFTLDPPIPATLLAQAVHFFRAVWERYQTEDVLLLYYTPADRRWELCHPSLLWASAAEVGYEVPGTPAGALLFGTFHSHGAMPAGHSLQDDRDVLGVPGIHVVIGDVDLPIPSLTCVFSEGRMVLQVSAADLFGCAEAVPFPGAWLKRRRLPDHPGRQRTAQPVDGKEESRGS